MKLTMRIRPLAMVVRGLLAAISLLAANAPASGQNHDPRIAEMLLDCASANWVLGHLAKSKTEGDDYLRQGAAFMTSYQNLTGRMPDVDADLEPRARRLKATSPADTAALFSTCMVILQVGVAYSRSDAR